MENPNPALFVVLGLTTAAVLLSWLYFRRFPITRPPLGVFNRTDIGYMIGGIILMPYLYLVLPLGLVAALLVIGALSVLYFLGEPVLRSRGRVGLASLGLVAINLGAALQFGTESSLYLIVNNGVLVLMVVGLTNLWAQSGMQARDAALLGAFLSGYDLTATWLLPLMNAMTIRLAALPFAPVVGWGSGASGGWVGIGLGDLLLAAVFPLVLRKAFGRGAGRAALVIALATLVTLLLVPVATIFPAMIVLGPLMVLQYLYWRRQGCERTTWQYLQAEPLAGAAAAAPPGDPLHSGRTPHPGPPPPRPRIHQGRSSGTRAAAPRAGRSLATWRSTGRRRPGSSRLTDGGRTRAARSRRGQELISV